MVQKTDGLQENSNLKPANEIEQIEDDDYSTSSEESADDPEVEDSVTIPSWILRNLEKRVEDLEYVLQSQAEELRLLNEDNRRLSTLAAEVERLETDKATLEVELLDQKVKGILLEEELNKKS